MYDFTITTQLKKKILQSRPIFKQSNYSFCRQEKGGYISVRSKNIPRIQELFLNHTSQYILAECDGRNTVEEVINHISKIYQNVQRETIANDVIHNISVLSKYQLIEWKERNPFMKMLNKDFENGLKFELLDESDIRELITFISQNENDVQFVNIMSKREAYDDELFLRDVLFNFTEDFFVIRKADKIKGLISLKYHANINSTVCSVGIFIAPKEYISELLFGIANYSSTTCNRPMSKIKIQILEKDCEFKRTLIEKLLDCGFVEENMSLKEYQGQNICNYSFYYEEEERKIC